MTLIERHAQPVSYSMLGLHIASEIALPELAQPDLDPHLADIRIRLDATPEQLEDVTHSAFLFSMNREELLLRVPECSRYWVRNGQEIVCTPEPNCAHPDLLVYLYGTCMAAICYQRRMIPFHACVVEHRDGAWLFAGASGAGKSTLAAGLLERGYRVWSDDLCALDVENCTVAPGVPRIKLWQNSIEHYGWQDKAMEPVVTHLQKFQFRTALRESVYLPLKGVFTLDTLHCNKVVLHPLQGVSAVKAIEKNLFRPPIIKGLDAKADYFSRCLKLAQKLTVWHIERPRKLAAMPAVLDLLEEALNE